MFNLQSGQEVAGVNANFTDADGNAANVQSVRWESSDPSTVDVRSDDSPEAAPGDQIVRDRTGAFTGDIEIKAIADVDLGDGIKEVTLVEIFRITAGEAAAGAVTISGTPRPRTEE